MAFVVQHGDPTYGPVLEILAMQEALRQRREAERREAQRQAAIAAQQQQQNMLSTLPQLLQGFAPGQQSPVQPTQQPVAIPADPATGGGDPSLGADPAQLSPADQLRLMLAGQQDSYNRDRDALRSRDARAAAFYNSAARYGDYGGNQGRSDQAVASIINNLIDNNQQGATQQAIAERQALSQEMMGDRQLRYGAMQGDVQLRNKLLGGELPQHIQEGLDNKTLRYSRAQKREMQDIKDSMTRARQSNRLTSEELMGFEAQQAMRLREIEESPEEVPMDEQPVPLQQQFEQETIRRDGGTWSRGRQNVWQFEPDRPDPQVEMDLERQQTLWGIEMKRYDALNTMWIKREPDRAKFTDQTDGANYGKLDQAGYDAARAEWLSQQPQLPPTPSWLNPSEGGPPGTTPPATPPAPPAPNQPPAAASSPDDIRQQIIEGNLGIGDVVQTPDGPREITAEVLAKLGF